MFRRDILSWWLRPAFLRPWGRRRDVLFAGPWAGEFGWELMSWQGFVRKLSRAYRRTEVCCPEGHEALYADFAHAVHPHRLRGVAECNALHAIQNPEELARIAALVPPDCDHLRPLGYQPFARQEIIRFGRRAAPPSIDVLFHARGRAFGADRNWSAANWETLLPRLQSKGYRLGALGLRNATLSPGGAWSDFRDRPLSETLDLIASARLVIGPSSGPMHLASLCGTPHVVWTDRGRYARGHTNRDKYEWWWNPLRTRVAVLDEQGFQPSPVAVETAVLSLLENPF